jgi:diaminopropionate ammonia-lyase
MVRMTERLPRYEISRFRKPGVLPHPPRDEIRAFHRALPGYAPTPLHRLTGLAASLGLKDVLVKDEGHRFGLKAFKSLGAAWALERIRRTGVPLSTVASATEGNHGRGVAWAARQLGLKAVIFMTTKASPRRIEAIRGEGAEVVLLEGTYEDAVRMCAERSAAEGWQVVADVGYDGYMEIPLWITEGYSTILEEVKEQAAALGVVPDVVIAQAGVGGFAAAVMEHFAAETPRPRLAILEPVEADPLLESAMSPDGRPTTSTGRQNTVMGGLNCSEVSLTAWPVIRDRADLYFSITDDFAFEAMRRYARPAAGDPRVVAGESGASGMAGLLGLTSVDALRGAKDALGLGPDSTVLVFITEGDTDPESWARITTT